MANLKFNIRPEIKEGSDLQGINSSDSDISIDYNNYYPAGVHVSSYRISAKLALSNVVVNEDLSIDFDYGGIQSVRAQTTYTTTHKGYNVHKYIYNANGKTVWDLNSDIGTFFDSYDITVATQTVQHYHVPANGSINIPEIKAFEWYCTGAQVSDRCNVYVGGTVTNIIPNYKPNGLRKSNEWKSVQELYFSTYIRQSNSWNDVGSEDVATKGQENKGHTRRRQGGKWLQENPFK